MCRCRFLYFFVDSLYLDSISLCSIGIFNYLSIIRLSSKCLTWKFGYTVTIICICTTIPCLNYPVVKDISIRCSSSSSRTYIGIFDICCRVCWCITTCNAITIDIIPICSIDNIYSISTIKDFTPFCI